MKLSNNLDNEYKEYEKSNKIIMIYYRNNNDILQKSICILSGRFYIYNVRYNTEQKSNPL